LIAFAALHFLERTALVVAAFVFVKRGGVAAFAASSVFALFFAARGIARSSAWSRVAAALHAQIVDALLERDLLRSAVLENDEPEAAVLEGLDSVARITVDLKPALYADVLASIVVGIFFVFTQSISTLTIGAFAVAITAAIVGFSRSRTLAESSREWIAYRPVIDRLVASIHARLEIVGNGSRSKFRAAFERDLLVWRDAIVRSERVLGAVGRAPLLIGGAVVVGVFVLARATRDGVTLDVISDAAIFGSALPPFAGLVRGLHEIRKATARAAPLREWLDETIIENRHETLGIIGQIVSVDWNDVSVRYPGAVTNALSGITIHCDKKSLVMIMGDNGSGKSTLLKSLLGVGELASGEISVDGKVIFRDAAWRGRLAYLPQRPYIGERLSAREVLAMVGDDIAEALAQRWLERVALWSVLAEKSPDDPLGTRVGTLSVGERQRLALARFFSRDRDVYLLDEPDANLDATGVTMVAALLRDLAKTKLVVVAAHTPELVAAGDMTIALEGGALKTPRLLSASS
ncbi:MAG: ATP-binding cassette domain-containing protein, partial [Polyangiaceae bacterium]